MKWLNNRFLFLSYIVLIGALVVTGCTSKEDPSEVLVVCGNHSCGDLAMVTTDTSSDGYHYLTPRMSPDGSRILFTADWQAIPAIRDYNPDDLFTSFRQIIVIPRRSSVTPATSLSDQGGVLVRFDGDRSSVWINNASVALLGIEMELRKSDPDWLTDDEIVFSVETPRGYRIFSADISGICSNQGCKVTPEVAYMEPLDNSISGGLFQHMQSSVSPDGEWIAFIRSGCALPDSFETCTGAQLMIMEVASMGEGNGYDCRVRSLTNEYSRIEKPSWSPDGAKLVFSGGMDLAGLSGSGTEIFTVDFDTAGFATDQIVQDNNLRRLTFTDYEAGDPITGVNNTSPTYTPDGSEIVFVSTRRAPAITLHDRNLWIIPSDGRLDPEIYFFTRSDDMDPEMLADGSILMSSQMGYPTEILDQLEDQIYQEQAIEEPTWNNVELRAYAAEQRQSLEYFEGVMSHMFIYHP